MSVHFNLLMSDDLNRDIDKIVAEGDDSKSEILCKALTLYLTAIDGNRRGLTLGLVDPQTGKLQTEIVGLRSQPGHGYTVVVAQTRPVAGGPAPHDNQHTLRTPTKSPKNNRNPAPVLRLVRRTTQP